MSRPWPVEPGTVAATDTRTAAREDEDEESSPPPAKKAVRQFGAESSDASSVASSDESSSDGNTMPLLKPIPNEPSISDPPPLSSSDNVTISGETPVSSPSVVAAAIPKPVRTTPEKYGTVISICKWTDNHSDGSARMVKWDDEEEPEKVRWPEGPMVYM